MKSEKFVKSFAAAAVMFVVVSAQAYPDPVLTPVYDNSVNFNPVGFVQLTNNQMVGQEVFPFQASSPQYLWSFSYEFYSPTVNFANTTIDGKVQFFANTGLGGSPAQTPFYDSGWYSLLAPQQVSPFTSFEVVNFSWQDIYGTQLPTAIPMDVNLQLPSDFTVVFSFQNLGVGDIVGLDNYTNPVVGNAYADFWVNNGTAGSPIWGDTNYVGAGVGAVMNAAATPAPEPSVIALSAVGGLLVTRLIRRRKA